jgi:hypothetical protein
VATVEMRYKILISMVLMQGLQLVQVTAEAAAAVARIKPLTATAQAVQDQQLAELSSIFIHDKKRG